MISYRIMCSGNFIYSYLFMGSFKQKLPMSTYINFEFFVNTTLLNISFSVKRSDLFVVTSPGKLLKFTSTVSQL